MTLVLGVMGQGPVSKKAVFSLLEDKLESYADSDVKFIFAITRRDDRLPRAVSYAVDYAIANKIPFDVITDDTSAELEEYEEIIELAQVTHKKIQRVGHKLARLLREHIEGGGQAEMLLAFKGGAYDNEEPDAGSDEDYTAFERATVEDLFAYDLADALEPLTFEEVEDRMPGVPFPADVLAEPEDDTLGVPVPAGYGEGEGLVEEPEEVPITFHPELVEDFPDTRAEAQKKGVRWAKAALRAGSNMNTRVVGQLSHDFVLDFMYPESRVDPANIPPTLPPLPASVPLPPAVDPLMTELGMPGPSTTVHQQGRTQRDIDLAKIELDTLRAALAAGDGQNILPLTVTIQVNLAQVEEFLVKLVSRIATEVRSEVRPVTGDGIFIR